VATIERVSDPLDPRLADYQGLTDTALRKRLEPAGGLFLAEGEKVIRRAVDAGCAVRSVLLAPRWLEPLSDLLDRVPAPVLVADEEVLRAVTGYVVHRGALASMERPRRLDVDEVLAGSTRLAVLEGVVDPTNVGVVFRAAAALGMDGVLLDPTCADPLYRRALKVSMGAVLAVPYARLERWPRGLDALRAAGYRVLALTPGAGAVAVDELDAAAVARCAVLLGTEGPGLSEGARRAADVLVRIPMHHGVDSLNVGAAAAVAFWEIGRRRTQ
jgi:tRNA G18 (ribose-2'-O)-methylase SpoU